MLSSTRGRDSNWETGIITDTIGWRWCFLINLPLGVITLVVTAFFLADPPLLQSTASLTFMQKLAKVDILGTIIFVPSIVVLLLALQWGGTTYGWANARIIVCFVMFAALLAAFAYLQYRKQDAATLPPRIIMRRSILAGMLFASCNNSALNVVEYYVSHLIPGPQHRTLSPTNPLSSPQSTSNP